MQLLRDVLRERGVAGMHGQRGRQALRDFARERRAGDDRGRMAGQALGDEFVQETAGSRVETLGRPGDADAGRDPRRDGRQEFVEGMARHDHEDRAGVARERLERGGVLQCVRKVEVGQVARVAACRRQVDDRLRRSSPQGRRYAVPRQLRGQRRAPGAGAENGDRRRCAHRILPRATRVRRSRPVRRTRLPRGGEAARRRARRS